MYMCGAGRHQQEQIVHVYEIRFIIDVYIYMYIQNVVVVATTPHLKAARWSNCKQRIGGQLTATDIKPFWHYCSHWFPELQSPSYFGPHPKCNCWVQCTSDHWQTGKSGSSWDTADYFCLIISYSNLEAEVISPIEVCLLCWECCTWSFPCPALWVGIPVGCWS